MENTIKDTLIQLELSTEDSFEVFCPTTRDRNDVFVLRCKKSGVIILNTTDHINEKYYENIDQWVDVEGKNYLENIEECGDDDLRRFEMIEPFIKDKAWVDYGTGAGGILFYGENVAKKIYAVEKQKKALEQLRKNKKNNSL